MRVSIVTISYNQDSFLEKAIRSVISQDYHDIEYIVVDAGSTDSSRNIIQSYKNDISRIIFEDDEGPADGLNKGFNHATGQILGFLNSDDLLLPGAISLIVNSFKTNLDIDVVSAHSKVIDEKGNTLRYCYSDTYSNLRVAYHSCFLIQPSTYFKSSIYYKTTGFNSDNRVAWDGELWIDMANQNAKFLVLNKTISCYRITSDSITGSKKLDSISREYRSLKFHKIMNRNIRFYDYPIFLIFRIFKFIRNPRKLFQRLIFGKVYGRTTINNQ